MKRFVKYLVLLLSVSTLSAQVGVRVMSFDNIELPFSYVYINGKAIGMADADGKFTIRGKERINRGDTISASYIGYNKGFVIFQGERNDDYLVKLSSDIVERIMVYGRKETRREFRQLKPYCPMSRASDYKARIVFDINGKEYFRGDYYHYLNPGTDENQMYLFLGDRAREIRSNKSKADILRNIVMHHVQDIFYTASRGVVTDIMVVNLAGIRIRKTGDKGRIKTFLLSRESTGKSFDKVISSAVYIDVDTLYNDVVEARMNVIKTHGKIELVATYSNYSYFRYPNMIEAKYTANDGNVYTVDIYDTKPMFYEFQGFSNRNSIDYWDAKTELTKYKSNLWEIEDDLFKELFPEDINTLLSREKKEWDSLLTSIKES